MQKKIMDFEHPTYKGKKNATRQYKTKTFLHLFYKIILNTYLLGKALA